MNDDHDVTAAELDRLNRRELIRTDETISIANFWLKPAECFDGIVQDDDGVWKLDPCGECWRFWQYCDNN